MTNGGRRPVLDITNETDGTLEVHIEPNPDRYLLAPGDVMTVDADLEGHPISLTLGSGALQIYVANDHDAPVMINGEAATTDWETEFYGPTAVRDTVRRKPAAGGAAGREHAEPGSPWWRFWRRRGS